MSIYKELKLVVKNSSWWKQKKYRRESASLLLYHRKNGWKLVKKNLLINKSENKDTRTFCIYYLKKNRDMISV